MAKKASNVRNVVFAFLVGAVVSFGAVVGFRTYNINAYEKYITNLGCEVAPNLLGTPAKEIFSKVYSCGNNLIGLPKVL
jgi:hypothetical protein